MFCRFEMCTAAADNAHCKRMDYEKRSEIALLTAYASMSLKHPKGKECTPDAMPDLEENFYVVLPKVHARRGFRLIESVKRTMTAKPDR
jgi:hypothetical protein